MTAHRAMRLLAAGSALILMSGAAVVSGPAAHAKSDGTLIVRDLPASVRLVPGEKVKIILSTNRTTGYSWSANGGCCTASGAAIAKVSKGVYAAPDNTNGMVGVAGQTTWTVTALRTGKTTVTVVTSPPGAQNTMNDETVGVLKITVMAK
jgi:predicted secreted protein